MQQESAETSTESLRESEPASHSFSDIGLIPGDRLQIYGISHADRTRHICRLVGFLENTSVIVTMPSVRGVRVDFRESEMVVVQAFSRNSAYAFKSTVERICRLPFDYMHLSFPQRIEGSIIRKATRVRLSVEARITAQSGSEPVLAKIDNISSTGALITSSEAVGDKGTELKVAFNIKLHDVQREIESQAVILNARNDDDGHHYGVEFRDLPADERMILRSLIYQYMIERPRSLV